MTIRSPNKKKAEERLKIEKAMEKYTPEKPSKVKKTPNVSRQKLKYDRYIHSEAWLKTKRAQIYKDLGSSCEICKSKEHIEMHHNNYKYLFNESPKRDIVVLCRECHSMIHKATPSSKLGKKPGKTKCNLCSNYGTSEKFYHYKSNYRNLKVCNTCHDALGPKINKNLLTEVKHPNRGLIISEQADNNVSKPTVKRRKARPKNKNLVKLSKFPQKFIDDVKILQKGIEKLNEVCDLDKLNANQKKSLLDLSKCLENFTNFFN